MRQRMLLPELEAKRTPWTRFLARVLRIANANPPGGDARYWFYRIKEQILERHGVQHGHDWQRITHHCNRCDGTGTWGYWRDDGGSWCWKCDGSGAYRRFFVRLERWHLADSVFHRPAEHVDSLPDGERCNIEGKIQHKGVKDANSIEACLWLALMFDQRRWWWLIRAPHISPRWSWFSWRTCAVRPMLAVNRLMCDVRECRRWVWRWMPRRCPGCQCFHVAATLHCNRCESEIPF